MKLTKLENVARVYIYIYIGKFAKLIEVSCAILNNSARFKLFKYMRANNI